MLSIPIYNLSGEQIETVEVDEQLLGGEVRPVLLKQAYVRIHANRRQGTSATKGRGKVEGSTRKLYKQKGTGNARRGAIRTNLMRGGGVAFGKVTKSWRQAMPRKMRQLANRNALLAKLVDQEVKVIDTLSFEKPSTRSFAGLLAAVGVDRSCLVALKDTTGPTAISARNLEGVSLTRTNQLNVFDMLRHRYLLVEKQELLSWVNQDAAAQAVDGGAA